MRTRPTGARPLPGVGGMPSHTTVTFVLPFSPGAVPTHVRISRRSAAALLMPANDRATAGGGPGFGGVAARVASTVVSAQ
jgi:hypothetical protein